MISIARISAASVFVLAVSGCSHQQPPDCSVPLYNVSQQLKKMAAGGEGEQARQRAKEYGQCFDQNPSYWLMRTTLLRSNFGDESQIKEDSRQGIEYINHAIALKPTNGYYKQGKIGFLVELNRDDDAVETYERVLSKVMRQWSDQRDADLERQGVFDAVAPYLQATKRQNKMEEARQRLSPFVDRICKTQPEYVTHYADTIIWLDQQLNGRSRDDVTKACEDFSA